MAKKRKLGIALSGGSARGLAHIGFLEVLEENHIPVDFIVGTSMGALIGGLYSAGKLKEFKKDILKFSKNKILSLLLSNKIKRGNTGSEELEKVLKKYVTGLKIENLGIEFVAIAIMGVGKEHIKWAPCLAFYTSAPEITVNNSSSKFEKFKNKYPEQILDGKGKINKQKILDLNLVDACDGICDDIVKIEYTKDTFNFHIEAWGQLNCKEIVGESVKVFNKALNDFSDKLKDIK